MSPTHIPGPFYLLVHTEQPLRPCGPNSGAEMATLNQARYLSRAGKRVIVAATLAGPMLPGDNVEYWDLGPEYDVEEAIDRAEAIGPFHLISAGRSTALFFARKRPLCLSKLLITHDRCAGDSGIKPHVLPHLVDKVLCVSVAQRDKLVSEGAPAAKMTVIHNGVDFDIFAPAPPPSHDPRRLIFCGALVPDKGLHLLLNSFVDLLPQFPDLKLDVYGDASLWARSEYLDIDRLGSTVPGLTFHGKRSQREIAEGFRRSGICVIPSIWFDPFPLTSLEAQACGCPVVTFNVGGLPEGILHGQTGIVVQEIEQSALTSALRALLSNPAELQRMSKESAEHVARHFRWETVASRIIELCEQNSPASQHIHWLLEEDDESAPHSRIALDAESDQSLTRTR